MDRLLTWWGGYIRVELSGDSPERLINLCGYNGIELWDLVCADGKYSFYVNRRDFKQLVGFVRKSKNRLIILEKQGLPFGLRRYRHRKVFVIGILLCMLLLYTLSLHIWEIDFDGNSYFTDELLRKTLVQEGYHTGIRKSQIVCDELEMRIREIYPEITWVSAQISGSRLYIQIRENTGILTVDEAEDVPCDLVALQDGVITEIITRSGTPMVKTGDRVTAGQVLIRGVVELYNDSKEKVGEHLVAADGDIQAQTEIIYQDRFPTEHLVKWYTGEKRYCLMVEAFGKRFSLDLSGISYPLKQYDVVTTSEGLCIGSQFMLPVSWQLSTLREYEENQAIYSKQQAFSLAEEKCTRFFEKLLEKGVQIIEKNVRIDMMGNECVAEGTVTVIQSISQSVPIAQKTGDQEETSN